MSSHMFSIKKQALQTRKNNPLQGTIFRVHFNTQVDKLRLI